MISQSYIVRVYRYEKDKPQKLMGVVEEVGAEGKKTFSNLDDLWDILNHPSDPDVSKGFPGKRMRSLPNNV